MNSLDTYLKSRIKSARALAAEVGVSSPYITDLRYGRRRPSAEVASRIEAATGGKVAATSWREAAE
jgi:DNA-binding transcriptional regulator YdaS (Cro superfamily)